MKYILILILATQLIACKQDQSSSQTMSVNPVSEDVTFKNEKDSIDLAGTLTLPYKNGVFTVVVLIAGNGEQDRNAAFGPHKPFLDIANYLTEHGIAVLRYDKRGVGKSGGDYSKATTFDLAEDVNASIAYLQTRNEVNKSRIGLIGHSEGGLIAPIIAASNSNVAFMVSLAGPSIPGDQILLSQQKAMAIARGTSENEIDKSQKLNHDAFEIVKQYKDDLILKEKMTAYIKRVSKNDPDKPESMTYDEYVDAQVSSILRLWMVDYLRYQPIKYLQQVKCPVLAINGTKDLQVLAKENLPAWQKILTAAGNENVTVKELPNLNHMFQNCITGLPDEYEEINESFSTDVMRDILLWITEQTK